MRKLIYEPRKEGEYIHVKGERVLEDNYPVHAGYAYLVDGVPFTSDITGDVALLKRDRHAEEIRNCNLVERDLL